MAGRTLRSTKNKTLIAMNDNSKKNSPVSDTFTAVSDTVIADSGVASGMGSGQPAISGMEQVLALMAQMMADSQRRDERRQDELEKKLEESERIRDDRDRQERREKEEREERHKREEEKRALVEEEKIQKAEEFHLQQMKLMREIKKEEDERQRVFQDRQREWKDKLEADKARESRIANALRTFPKITSYTLLPSQLNNYNKLLTGLEATDLEKRTRLPEVLSGSPATTFQNMAGEDYSSFEDLKTKFLTAAGITFSSAGKAFVKPDLEALRKLSAVDLWSHLKGLVQRILSGAGTVKEAVSVLCLVFLNVNGSSNLILSLAGCSQVKEEEIQQALFKTHEAFGQVLGYGESFSQKKKVDSKGSGRCEFCGKSGHKSVDCWSKPKTKTTTCYSCNKEGHISLNCPEKGQGGKGNETNSKLAGQEKKKGSYNKTSVVREPSVSTNPSECMMKVEINGRSLRMLPDSGAQVSVIPPSFVAPCQYTGDSTCLVDFEGKGDRRRRVAIVNISVGGSMFRERVAVSDHLGNSGLLSLPILDESRSSCILKEFYRQRRERVGAVQTRAETRTLQEMELLEEAVMAEEAVALREVKDGMLGGMNGSELDLRIGEVDTSVPKDSVQEERVHEENVHDFIGSEGSVMPENCETESCLTPESASNSSEVIKGDLGSTPVSAERCSRPVSAETVGEYAQLDCLRGGSDRKEIVELTKSDSTLAACRRLASQRERGYSWECGVLTHKYLNELGEVISRIVVPKQKRAFVCQLAHDRMGHLGHRKLREILSSRFTWPRIGQDLEEYVMSCNSCQLATKRGQRKAPMVERPILSEPFEAVAIDLVGPFPLAKGRFRFLLTCICLATRWPEVVTLKSITAKSVADGLVSIFSHTGLPFVILCDNGSQFTGKLMKELSDTLGIEVKHSSPYHPESNGLIERMHSTLSSMLRKAGERNLDWAEQVPFALFALRQMPCRSTGLSPYELVWGSKMRTPLDILYRGWKEKLGDGLNVSEWTVKLYDKLDVLRDVAVGNAREESEKRKAMYDKGKCVRQYVKGDKVLVRVAGKNGKLIDSWEGPFEIVKVLSTVNYKVKACEGKKERKVHVNLCKTFRERVKVGGVTVLATEEGGLTGGGAVVCGEVVESVLREVKEVLGEFVDIMDGEPGTYTGEPLSVSIVDGAVPVSTKPYRIPEAVKPKVKEALDSLIERGWVVKSTSPWASPIVPVAKPDGSVRLCVNYKKLNDSTCQQQFPIPHFEDILAEIGQAKVLSKMDLMKGYHQVPLSPECQDLTGFVTPWGCFKYTVLPFGLKNAPAQFQRLMCDVLSGCSGFSLVYIDDVLVYSRELEGHANHVRLVLNAIKESGLRLNPEKCRWARSRVEFLGHVVGAGKVSVPGARVKALRDFLKPVTRRDLRAALGTFGYYRKFVPNYASITMELNQATSTKATHKVHWTPGMDRDFSKLKSVICNVCELCVPCEGDGFVLHTDASGRGVGAVLYVCRNQEELPVAFYSRPVRGAETRYSATELEALAVVQAVNHFVPYLYGRSFEIVTDHAPLCGLMTSPNLNRRLRGFMLKLLEFDFTITYRPGDENLDADGLSRQAWESEDDSATSGCSLTEPASILKGGDVGTPTQERDKKEKKRKEPLPQTLDT